jgi:hypothetical protein
MVVVLLLPSVLVAQTSNKQYTENKADLGLRADARIDPSTLAMSLEIPLGGAPGRAGTSVSSVLRYSSKQWRMNYAATFRAGASLHTWTRTKFSEDAMAGWTSSLDAPWIEYTGRNQPFDCSNASPMSDDPDAVYDDVCFIARVHLHLPDGSRHELRKDDDFHEYNETITGLFYSVDGSRLIYDTATSTLPCRLRFSSTRVA